MPHKFNPDHKAKLDDPARRRILPPRGILLDAGLKAGDTVADIGAGTGYFAIPAAEIVGPRGRVFALDISPEMLKSVRAAADAAGLANVETRLSTEYDPALEESVADLALLSTVVHEVEDHERLLRGAYALLKPGGILLIIEWRNVPMEMGPPAHERIAPEDAARAAGNTGFVRVHAADLNEFFYTVRAYRPDSGAGATGERP
jgi:ubiquinone/menaquinone biosynthesis C-methylase UbiE